MIVALLTGLGFVAVIEGLALALAPSRIEEVLALLTKLDIKTRRLLGLVAVAVGVLIVGLARFVSG
ncbi:MAG: DUF2065 domain-containing protein [Alphaproteobacteria bacterium]|nr:DUF2065 domain-containing protein [Alphaproteobacteria bacterium]